MNGFVVNIVWIKYIDSVFLTLFLLTYRRLSTKKELG